MQEFLAAEYFAYNIVQAVNKIQWAPLKIQNANQRKCEQKNGGATKTDVQGNFFCGQLSVVAEFEFLGYT